MKLADIKKKMAAAEKELERRNADLNKLKEQRAALDAEITDAIDSGNDSGVEKLVARQLDLDNKILAQEKIIARKRETSGVSEDEIINAANVETAEYQRQINKAEAVAQDAKREYYRKIAAVAALVNAAWDARTEYVSLLPGIESPNTFNPQTSKFNMVSYHASDIPEYERAQMRETMPEELAAIVGATRSRVNMFVGRK